MLLRKGTLTGQRGIGAKRKGYQRRAANAPVGGAKRTAACRGVGAAGMGIGVGFCEAFIVQKQVIPFVSAGSLAPGQKAVHGPDIRAAFEKGIMFFEKYKTGQKSLHK